MCYNYAVVFAFVEMIFNSCGTSLIHCKAFKKRIKYEREIIPFAL